MIESTGGDGKPLDVTHLVLASGGKTMLRDYEAKTPDNQQKRHEIYEKR